MLILRLNLAHLQDVVESKALSGLQLESIVYACQRHEQFLPDGSRCAFFIGDGKRMPCCCCGCCSGSDLGIGGLIPLHHMSNKAIHSYEALQPLQLLFWRRA